MLDHALDKDERSTEIDVERVIKLFQGDVPHIWEAFTIASIGDKDIWSLPMLLLNLLEHGLDLLGRTDVDLVDRDTELVFCMPRLKIFEDSVHGVEVAGISQSKMDTMLRKLIRTG